MENKQKKTLFYTFVSVVIALLLTAISLGVVAIVGKDDKNSPNKWYSGVETPVKQGTDGDFYIDTDDYLLYQKINGAWTVIMQNFGKGEPGQDGVGILKIEKTSTDGLVDTYTITFTNGTTTTFTITNGKDGEDGVSPTVSINEQGYWVINGVPTNVKAQGENGKGIVSISKTSSDGLVDTYTIEFTDGTTSVFTVTNGSDGTDGQTPTIVINEEGYWVINGVTTDVKAHGENGKDGISIVSVKKTATNGLVDTYTILYSDGSETTFTITNGKDGEDGATPTISINNDGYWVINGVTTNIKAQGESGNGIESITKTSSNGLVDTYTIRFTDGSTTTFTVTNGSDGEKGEQGLPGTDGTTPTVSINEDGYWVINGEVTEIKAQGENGKDGVGIVSVKKTATHGNVDTYTITFTDGKTTTFTVTNSQDLSYTVHQELNYNESIKTIANPEQGFTYALMYRNSSENDNKVLDFYPETRTFRLLIDLSSYSSNATWTRRSTGTGTTQELPESFLNSLRNELNLLKSKDKNVVVRCSYLPYFDQSQPFDKFEPEFTMLLKHAEQIATLLNEFQDTVVAIEGGFIGNYGEMTADSDYTDSTHINQLIDKLLDNSENIPVLVRRPQMMYDYCGITADQVKNNEKVVLTEKQKRLGIYNDAMFGSPTDYDTYNVTSWAERCQNIVFQSQFTDTPFGGETLVTDSGATHFLSKFPSFIPEGHLMNLTYLSAVYHPTVITQWKNTVYTEELHNSTVNNINDMYAASGFTLRDDSKYYGQTAYKYIENHMGYRFVLKSSTFNYTCKYDSLKVDIELSNVGFGKLLKSKTASLIFVDKYGSVVHEQNVGTFDGSDKVSFTATGLDIENGEYKVYLNLSSGEKDLSGNKLYSIQFANEGSESWKADIRGNLLGSLKVEK